MTIKTVKSLLICCIIAGLSFTPAILFADQNQGRNKISLYGGKSGTILFPHHTHQKIVADCQTCHVNFAQEEGALGAAKKSEVLKKKQVMNKTCLKCHRALKKAGEKSGPTNCKGCHTK